MGPIIRPVALAYIAKTCGTELARAHARSGDSIAIASYLGSSDAFERAVAAFAESYADQNERDYAALKAAVESGRVKAEMGV
jgi:thiamine monophosphate kinase